VDVRVVLGLFPLALAGCFDTTLATLPQGIVEFVPASGGPAGWVVETNEMDASITCPDGQIAQWLAVYPEGATAPMPVAVVLHSGAFDYLTGASPTDPLSGTSFQPEPRLNRDWAVRRVFFTLGMYDEVDVETSTGTLAAALANHGVAMLLPVDCWGDWWHNEAGTADNAFVDDHFYRNGRFMADFTWRLAAEPGFASANRIALPFTPDGQVYAVGLGEGGRGVGELIVAGATPTAAIVDSSTDDLRPYYEQPDLYQPVIDGLNRIFPGGANDTITASLANASPLPPIVYVYSSLDAQIPVGSHDPALARLGGRDDATIIDAAVQKHVLLNDDAALADQAVTTMTSFGAP
jgi:hypothetical protein